MSSIGVSEATPSTSGGSMEAVPDFLGTDVRIPDANWNEGLGMTSYRDYGTVVTSERRQTAEVAAGWPLPMSSSGAFDNAAPCPIRAGLEAAASMGNSARPSGRPSCLPLNVLCDQADGTPVFYDKTDSGNDFQQSASTTSGGYVAVPSTSSADIQEEPGITEDHAR
ncbi:hypothetical protein MTO96_024457 [Rhipicephalus appendiculatus]